MSSRRWSRPVFYRTREGGMYAIGYATGFVIRAGERYPARLIGLFGFEYLSELEAYCLKGLEFVKKMRGGTEIPGEFLEAFKEGEDGEQGTPV